MNRKRMKDLWQLLPLLLSILDSGATRDCSDAESTVVVQLSRTQILRTWQPDGAGCRWWENRISSETDQFPAAVRSGPRWLVMQLRQPMMLEAVSVRGWDGQWQAAAPVGSPVSAVGASSLPLELQLEDPCRASWEAFNSSERWRQLGGTEYSAIRYILVNSQTSSALSWSRINATGRIVPLNLTVMENWHCPLRDLSAMQEGSRACFSVSSCRNESVSCFFKLYDGSMQALNQLGGIQKQPAEFEFAASFQLHGATLTCNLSDRLAVRIEQSIGIVFRPTVAISVSTIWVSGRTATVNFVSSLAYPAQQHSCFIRSGNGKYWNLTMDSAKTKLAVIAQSNMSMKLASMESQFIVKVSSVMLNGELRCVSRYKSKDGIGANLMISQLSEPCETVIDLSQLWCQKVRVTSLKCSIWNVSHNCWLKSSTEEILEPLTQLSDDGFTSTHMLNVTEDSEQHGWLVRCSVNQSGLLYPGVEAKLSLTESGIAAYFWPLVTALLLLFAAAALAVSFKLARIACNAQQQPAAPSRRDPPRQHNVVSAIDISQQIQPPDSKSVQEEQKPHYGDQVVRVQPSNSGDGVATIDQSVANSVYEPISFNVYEQVQLLPRSQLKFHCSACQTNVCQHAWGSDLSRFT